MDDITKTADTSSVTSDRVTFFIGTYGYGLTRDFMARRMEDGRKSFRLMFIDNPFIQLAGTPSGCVMGYEDWTHARHVTNINGCKRHQITLLKVELNADSLERLVADGKGKLVRDEASKRIWQISLFDLLKVAEAEVTFTVLAPTSHPAVELGEFALPEHLLGELRSARTDCLQSLVVAMVVDENAYKRLFQGHETDFDQVLFQLMERVGQLSQEERLALVELI